MEEESLSIVVESRNGQNDAADQSTALTRGDASDVAGASHQNDDATPSESSTDTATDGRGTGGVAGDLATGRSAVRQRGSVWRTLTGGRASDDLSADDELERKGLFQGSCSASIAKTFWPGKDSFASGSGSSGGGSGRRGSFARSAASGRSGENKGVEAPIRVRRVDFDAKNENHYVIVIHGTFDAPPPDGAPTWYQPPAPGEQNFCRKLSRLLALGPIGQDAIWRELPCSALPGIPYPFHWDGTNTHAGRVTAATKLHKLIDQIAQNDPAARIHLVAHSHGGNVLLKTVELYMAKLSRRQKNEWHPAVAQQFWAAHKRSYELIKKWRRIELGGSWWRFFPFLVVYRGFNGRKAVGKVKERYPWAYHQWLDSLLGLPAVRQQRFLAFRHATSPITNALGALVFLGTPFYIKKWEKNGLLWMSLSTVINVVLMYIFILAYTSIWQIIVLLIAGRPEDFYSQSAAQFIIATGIMLLINVKQIMDVLSTTVFYSGNLYHNPAFDWSPAMSALVIHAGKLDEASLALSMEPIARAYVFPHLTKLLKQTPWAPFPKPPTRYARQVDWWAYSFHCLIILVWDTVFFLPAAIIAVLSHIVAPIVTGSLQKMIVTVSFGLAPGDLSNAYIYVDEHLDMELATQQVDHWNVQKLLAEAKTKSLKGELMPGYEDDTLDQPEWLGPILESPHTPQTPHTPHTPHSLHTPRSVTPGLGSTSSRGFGPDSLDSEGASPALLGTQFHRTRSAFRKRGSFRDSVLRRSASETTGRSARGGRLAALNAVAEAAVQAHAEEGLGNGSGATGGGGMGGLSGVEWEKMMQGYSDKLNGAEAAGGSSGAGGAEAAGGAGVGQGGSHGGDGPPSKLSKTAHSGFGGRLKRLLSGGTRAEKQQQHQQQHQQQPQRPSLRSQSVSGTAHEGTAARGEEAGGGEVGAGSRRGRDFPRSKTVAAAAGAGAGGAAAPSAAPAAAPAAAAAGIYGPSGGFAAHAAPACAGSRITRAMTPDEEGVSAGLEQAHAQAQKTDFAVASSAAPGLAAASVGGTRALTRSLTPDGLSVGAESQAHAQAQAQAQAQTQEQQQQERQQQEQKQQEQQQQEQVEFKKLALPPPPQKCPAFEPLSAVNPTLSGRGASDTGAASAGAFIEGTAAAEDSHQAQHRDEQQQQQAEEQQQQQQQQQEQQQEQQPTEEQEEGEKLVYEFLWDDKELSLIAEQSQTYQRLKSQMHKIGRNPRLTEAEFERQLKQLCVMIEERMGELTGRFDLNHGAYFRDPRILRVIAHFLEKRELPEWSKNIDGDIWRWNEHLAKIQSLQRKQMTMRSGSGLGKGASEGMSSDSELSKASSGGKLKSLLKSMRGGSGREGGSKAMSRARNPSLESLNEHNGTSIGSVGSGGGSAGFGNFGASQAVSFGGPGLPRPKLDLPNLNAEAIAAPVRRIKSSVAAAASTLVSSVNTTSQRAESALMQKLRLRDGSPSSDSLAGGGGSVCITIDDDDDDGGDSGGADVALAVSAPL